MEIIICLLLAGLITGGRAVSDIVHAVKGTTPPHVEKARLKAQTSKPAKSRSAHADGKPRLRDVAAVYWGDAMADAIDAHNRRRAEKQAQRLESERAAAAGETPVRVRPTLKQRIVRVARLLWEPVGENQPAPISEPAPQVVTAPQPLPAPAVEAQPRTEPAEEPAAATPAPSTEGVTNMTNSMPAHPQPTTSGPTGEVANYETAIAELDALEDLQQQHLDQALAARTHAAGLMQSVSNTQTTYRPAAEAGANTHQSLDALHLDQETVANTGTIVDAMPPNRVDEMFTLIEQVKVDVDEQVSNAEAALQATRNARSVITAKYGDAHATVAGELSGDSRFLAGSGVAA